MFTGIVDHCGRVEKVESGESAMRLWIESRFSDLVEGESISVDGACLTVIEPKQGKFRCDVSKETLALTIAWGYVPGTPVNLERALRLSDRLGGHIVTGHVDGRGVLESERPAGEYREMRFTGLPEGAARFLIKKGSVCVNGVSLTVNEVVENSFAVMLIPHTLERTNLGSIKPGDPVNLEMDWMVKVILNDKERSWNDSSRR